MIVLYKVPMHCYTIYVVLKSHWLLLSWGILQDSSRREERIEKQHTMKYAPIIRRNLIVNFFK